jgi:tetratricopeptide (TPR) repeat protein
MRWRLPWLVCLIAFGCYCASASRAGMGGPAAGAPPPRVPAEPVSRPRDGPAGGTNHLSLAAAYLEKGDDRRACEHLGAFLRVEPEHRNARYYYAELLLKLGRPGEARTQFEHAVAFGQDESVRDLKHLVHCHGRLMEVGELLDDEFAVRLHRGIGMFLLAQQRAALAPDDGGLATESLLCKAAAELATARTLRPDEARPCWYLYAVWRQLAQHQQAGRWLHLAHNAAPFTYLSPAEYRGVELASRALPHFRP